MATKLITMKDNDGNTLIPALYSHFITLENGRDIIHFTLITYDNSDYYDYKSLNLALNDSGVVASGVLCSIDETLGIPTYAETLTSNVLSVHYILLGSKDSDKDLIIEPEGNNFSITDSVSALYHAD